jgi:hypothetical protein
MSRVAFAVAEGVGPAPDRGDMGAEGIEAATTVATADTTNATSATSNRCRLLESLSIGIA